MYDVNHDAEIRKFGKGLLLVVLGFVAICVVPGAVLTMILH
jgi:hypothetical protein